MTPREKKVLGYCNGVRESLGFAPRTELLPGVRHSPWSCPVANTIRGGPNDSVEISTDRTRYFLNNGMQEFDVNHPKYVSRFVGDFDNGKLPHLEVVE